MKVLDVLRAARKKIERPEAWTRRWSATDRRGNAIESSSADAVCYCGYGAIWSLNVGQVKENKAEKALDEAVGEHFPSWQDVHTHTEVLAAFDRAIAAEEGKQ